MTPAPIRTVWISPAFPFDAIMAAVPVTGRPYPARTNRGEVRICRRDALARGAADPAPSRRFGFGGAPSVEITLRRRSNT
jgi:hypothetical protein